MQGNKIKILHLSRSFSNISGAALIANNTYRLFNNDEFESEVFSQASDNDDEFRYREYFVKSNYTGTSLDKFLYFYNWTGKKNIEPVLDDFKPDIIHIHDMSTTYMSWFVLKPCLKRNIPTVMTLHDCSFICPCVTFTHGNGKKCKKILCKGYNKVYCMLYRCFSNNIFLSSAMSLLSFIPQLAGFDKAISMYITPSEALKKLIAEKHNHITADKIVTINNYLVNDEIKNTQPNYNNNGYFLYIGRLDITVKGLDTLLQAMKDLPGDINLRIIGKEEHKGQEEILKQYAKENHLDNVKFCGFKNRKEIKEEYQNCIASILPSTAFESFGLTTIEAAINGKPSIASNIGGIPEIVEHNKTGLLFEPRNTEQLKECILTYWNNPDLVKEHGENAYKKAIEKYTEERYYKETANMYRMVLAKKKNYGKA